MVPLSDAREARDLIRQCLAGDLDAARIFQEKYGELIYGYPIRVYRMPAEEAGDFYVFAFDQGRIFRRVRSFEGRAPFRAYLLGFVLDDLVLEWRRGIRTIETVSIETLGELPGRSESPENVLDDGNQQAVDRTVLSELLAALEPSKSVVMKLLYVEDYELKTAELRYLAEVSGRPIPEVLSRVDQLRATVRVTPPGVARFRRQ